MHKVLRFSRKHVKDLVVDSGHEWSNAAITRTQFVLRNTVTNLPRQPRDETRFMNDGLHLSLGLR